MHVYSRWHFFPCECTAARSRVTSSHQPLMADHSAVISPTERTSLRYWMYSLAFISACSSTVTFSHMYDCGMTVDCDINVGYESGHERPGAAGVQAQMYAGGVAALSALGCLGSWGRQRKERAERDEMEINRTNNKHRLAKAHWCTETTRCNFTNSSV